MLALFFPSTAKEAIWPFIRKMEPWASPTWQWCPGFLISMSGDLLSSLAGVSLGDRWSLSDTVPQEKMLRGRFINSADQPCRRQLWGGGGRTLAPGSQWTLLTFHFFDIYAENPRLLSWGDEKERMATVRKLKWKKLTDPGTQTDRMSSLMGKGRSQ